MAEYQHPLMERQIELEREMADTGREHFLNEMRKARENRLEANMRPAKTIMNKYLVTLSATISTRQGIKPSRQSNETFDYIDLLDHDVVSFLTLKTILDGISQNKPLVALAISLATRIEDEVHLQKFKSEQKELFRITEKKAEGQSRHRQKMLFEQMANRNNIAWSKWGKQIKTRIGVMLIRLVVQNTDIVVLKMITRGKGDTVYHVVPTPATLAWLKECEDRLGLLSPAYWPTVIPPKRWTNPYNGGYWTPAVRNFPLVKTRSRKYLEELALTDMPGVYAAVNAIQETPWKVNERILETLAVALDRGLSIGKIPSTQDIPFPPAPADIDENPEAKRVWKKETAIIHDQNMAMQSKRLQVIRTVRTATQFSPYEEIFFPHQLDFRGRAYSVPTFLNPQGSDYQKALLKFAKGKEITDEGQVCWLAIHGSNLYGNDKVDLQSRVDWVAENEDAIFSAAEDPFGRAYEFWTKAGDPWCFLAFCFEYDAMVKAGVIGFVTTLPVQLDGTCNGLQHFSAALLDPVGAKAVNLIPSEQPQDIYGVVAGVTMEKLKAVIQSGILPPIEQRIAEAARVLGLSRKVTKRVVMCLPYGLSRYSAREYVEEGLRDLVPANTASPFAYVKHTIDDKYVPLQGFWEASFLLTPLIWEAIEETVQGARIAMDWLQDCARVAAGEGMPVNWTTPDGFFVEQRYLKYKSKTLDTVLDGRIQLSYREETDLVDSRAMTQAIAPNWVHSMDGCALRMYVCLAKKQGIRHFSMVHDSYGTLATDVETMRQCLKQAFVTMYKEHDVLGGFHTEIAAVVSLENLMKMPLMPEKGDLDLDVVLGSDFFFA